MSKIQYCDRCGVELQEGKRSGHVMGTDDADTDGGGYRGDIADLCVRCYAEFRKWLRPRRKRLP